MCIVNKCVFLMRDFNARTCNKDGFVDTNDFLTHYFSLDDTMNGSLNMSSKFIEASLHTFGKSQDKTINNDDNV